MTARDERDRERADDLILDETELGHCLRLVVPPELTNVSRSTWAGYSKAGVWLIQIGKGRSPAAMPISEGRLLSKAEALSVAAALDAVARPRPHFDRDEHYPRTYVAFLERWYKLLGERLHLAIDAAETRRTELRELRAALTGDVS